MNIPHQLTWLKKYDNKHLYTNDFSSMIFKYNLILLQIMFNLVMNVTTFFYCDHIISMFQIEFFPTTHVVVD